jgi:hypothetical protein
MAKRNKTSKSARQDKTRKKDNTISSRQCRQRTPDYNNNQTMNGWSIVASWSFNVRCMKYFECPSCVASVPYFDMTRGVRVRVNVRLRVRVREGVSVRVEDKVNC